jgi:hypothetical protein
VSYALAAGLSGGKALKVLQKYEKLCLSGIKSSAYTFFLAIFFYFLNFFLFFV